MSRTVRIILTTLLLAGCGGSSAGSLTFTTTTPARQPVASAPSAPPFPTSTRRRTVVVVGDSLGFGLFASSATRSYAARVRSSMAERGPVTLRYPSYRRGDRRTTAATIQRVPANAAAVVLEVGTNDVGARTPLATFERTYRRLATRARKGSPEARFVCLGAWGTETGTYDRVIAAVCDEIRGRYAPLTQLFVDPANRGPAGRRTPKGRSDDFHPNDRGHLTIARIVERRLGLDVSR